MIKEVLGSGTINIGFVAILISIILLPDPFMMATASAVEKSFETEGWTISYQISFNETEPDSEIILNITIESKAHNYDFELWIRPSSPLSTANGYIHYSELSTGEKRRERFIIGVPAYVEEDEKYSIHLRAQSHNNPPGPLGRILDAPEYIFDTVESPQHVLEIIIVLKPSLTISDLSVDQLIFDQTEFTLTVIVKNEGKGIASNVKAEINMPEGVVLMQGDKTLKLGDIDPGSQKIASWKLSGAAGMHAVNITASASNFNPIYYTGQISIISRIMVIIPIVAFIAGIIVVFIIGKTKDWW